MNSLYCNTFLSCLADMIIPNHHIKPLRDTILSNFWIVVLACVIGYFKLRITSSNKLIIAKLLFNQIIIVAVGLGFLSQYWIFVNMIIDMFHTSRFYYLMMACSYPYERLSILLFTYLYSTIFYLCDSPYLDEVQNMISLGNYYQGRPISVIRQHFALTYLFNPTLHVFWSFIYLSSFTENKFLFYYLIAMAITWYIVMKNLLKTISLLLTLVEKVTGYRLPTGFIDGFNSISLIHRITRSDNGVYNISSREVSVDEFVNHVTNHITPIIVQYIFRSRQPNHNHNLNALHELNINNFLRDDINNRGNSQGQVTLFQQRCHELVISDISRFRTTTKRTDIFFSKDDLINYFQQRWSTTITNWKQPSKYDGFYLGHIPIVINEPNDESNNESNDESVIETDNSNYDFSDGSEYEIHFVDNHNLETNQNERETNESIPEINQDAYIRAMNTLNESEHVSKKKTYEKEFRLTYEAIYKMLEKEPNEAEDEEFELFLKRLFLRHKLLDGNTSNTIPCIICDDAPRDVLNLPCKHLVSCTSCSAMQSTKQCAICKGIVLQTLQIHIS